MTSAIELSNELTCPSCAGTGKVVHTYKYKPQHRSDIQVENIERRDMCPVCNGVGQLTTDEIKLWKQVAGDPVCPVCNGEGGKYFWSWYEGETGTRKQFVFEPCSLCAGTQHISPEQFALHERERRKLRFWGVGCTFVVVVGGLFVVTQGVSILLARTPFLQCCAPPHVVFVSGMIVMSRKMGWF